MTTPAPRPQTLAQRLLRAAAITASASWAAGLLGRTHWALELFSHFLPFYAVTLLLAVLLCPRPRRQWALFALILVLQCIQLGTLYLPAPAAVSHSTDRRLKAISFNLYLHNADMQQAVPWLLKQDADLIFLTEVTPFMQPVLQQLQRNYPWHCEQADDSPFGLALYSRLPLAQCAVNEGMATPYPWLLAILDDSTPVYGLHPPPPLGATLAQQRKLYLRELAGSISRQERAIVLGDLNMTPWSPDFGAFLQQAGLENGRRGFGVLPSWTPQAWLPPLLPLDHVLVKQASVAALRSGPALGSDHSPLRADIYWPLRPQDGDAARSGGILHPDGQSAVTAYK